MSAPTLTVGATLPGSDRDVWTSEVGSLQWASRQARGGHQRALGALIAVIGSREITAGVEPAHRNGKVATLTVGLSHDVSSLLGIGPPSLAATRTLRSRSCGRRMRVTGEIAVPERATSGPRTRQHPTQGSTVARARPQAAAIGWPVGSRHHRTSA